MTHVPTLLRFDVAHKDVRGIFFNIKAEKALTVNQVSLSNNPKRYTFRGMHWQTHESPDHKFVCVTEGAIVDILIDVELGSSTFGQQFFFVIGAGDGIISIPPSYAHGFLTLKDNTNVLYLHEGNYEQRFQRKMSPFACDLPPSILRRIKIVSNEDLLGLKLNDAKY